MHGEKIKMISFDEAQTKLCIEGLESTMDDPNLLMRNGKVYLTNDAVHLSKEVDKNKIYLSVEVKGNYSRDGISFSVALVQMSDLRKVVNDLDYEKLEDIFRRNVAGILAKELKEGECCPVCGSSHHPSLAVLEVDSINEEAVKEAKLKTEEAYNTREKYYRELTKIKAEVDSLKNDYIKPDCPK